MRGYAFLNADGNLSFRTEEYIVTENPLFWKDNQDFIIQVWRFDTEDTSSMYQMLKSFKFLRLKSDKVLSFIESIKFDMQKVKDYAANI
jgi:hypothetical protein